MTSKFIFFFECDFRTLIFKLTDPCGGFFFFLIYVRSHHICGNVQLMYKVWFCLHNRNQFESKITLRLFVIQFSYISLLFLCVREWCMLYWPSTNSMEFWVCGGVQVRQSQGSVWGQLLSSLLSLPLKSWSLTYRWAYDISLQLGVIHTENRRGGWHLFLQTLVKLFP